MGQKTNEKTGRQAKHYVCASCHWHFPVKEVHVDHISPIIDPEVGFTSWDDVINNMFCEQENLQCLCIGCHKAKTLQEKQLAKERKNASR